MSSARISNPTHTFLLMMPGRKNNSNFTGASSCKKNEEVGDKHTNSKRCPEEDMISQKRESTVTDSCPSKEAYAHT